MVQVTKNTISVGNLVCVEGGGIIDRLAVDRNAHIGRVPLVDVPELAKLPGCGTLGGNMGKSALAINIQHLPNSVTVSQHHALLTRGALAGNNQSLWTVMDLGSTNGTYVENCRINTGNLVQLRSGTLLQFGAVKFIFTTTEVPITSSALVVGSPGSFLPLKGVDGDMQEIIAALKKRKQIQNIDPLYYKTATKEAVLERLAQYAQYQIYDSLTVLYYSGHGSLRGLCTHSDSLWSSNDLSPRELYDQISKIQGQKIILLDSCHSSIFLKDVPPQTLLISEESPTGHMYEGAVTVFQPLEPDLHEQSTSLFLSPNNKPNKPQFTQGLLTRSIIKYLEAHPNDSIDLKHAITHLQGYHRLQERKVQLYAAGATVNF